MNLDFLHNTNPLIMHRYFFYFCLLVGFSSCDQTKLAESHASLKIIGGNVFAAADAPTRLSDNIKTLIMPLSKHPTNEDCNVGHLLDITFHNLVSYQQMSFRLNRRTKTVGDINFVSVAQRIARMQLDNFQLAENFLAADTMTHSLAKRWEQVMSLVNPQDSILVYFSNKADSIKSYSWKEKSYPVVATLGEVREQINHMICEHKQLYYVLLMDPPHATSMPSRGVNGIKAGQAIKTLQ